MDPQAMAAAIGAGLSVGIAGSAVINHFLGNGKNGKVELLLEQLVGLAGSARKQDTAVAQTLALIQKDLENHERRESQAWRDAFALLRNE